MPVEHIATFYEHRINVTRNAPQGDHLGAFYWSRLLWTIAARHGLQF